MKVSSTWLQKWLRRTILSDSEIVTALERAGIEVEQLIVTKPIDTKVIVGLVKKVAQHPAADRLRVAEVETGQGNLHIVCGAPNLKTGMKVAVAQIGTLLPSGDRISAAKLRGEVSEGMLCSELELALGRDHTGIMDLAADTEVGARLCDIFPTESVIDLKTPANRFDLQSVEGLAREVAAMTSAELVNYNPKALKPTPDGPAIEKGPLAQRYMLLRVRVDQAAPTPSEIAARLRASGVRAIGPVVDVTNYVMLELGQPLHAFDAAKVKLPISVRMAQAGEKLLTLDGVLRKLTAEDLVVADESGPVALAGVMGGEATEVSPGTSEILLESAVFDPAIVRKMAQRHNLRSEASARMERGLPVELPSMGAARAVELLELAAEGSLVAVADNLVKPARLPAIEFSVRQLSRLVGIDITGKQVIQSLAKLGISAEAGDSSEVVMIGEVPWWRPDLRVWQDLAEEVIRVVGYDKLPSTIPTWRPKELAIDRVWPVRRRIRDLLYGAGLFEVMTYSFVSEEQLASYNFDPDQHLKIKNPISSEQAYLRSSMLASHLAVAERNRTYAKRFGFYEVAHVFGSRGRGKQPDEPLKLAVTLFEAADGYRSLKGVLDALARELNLEMRVTPMDLPNLALGRSGRVGVGSLAVGVIGQVDPAISASLKIDGELAFMEVDLGPLISHSSVRQFAGVQKFPMIRRDLSLLVPTTTTWQALRDVVEGFSLTYVSDYYDSELPNGSKVMTIRLEVSNSERTPTDAEASEQEAKLIAILQRKIGASRRE